jgi:hypothetical protein
MQTYTITETCSGEYVKPTIPPGFTTTLKVCDVCKNKPTITVTCPIESETSGPDSPDNPNNANNPDEPNNPHNLDNPNNSNNPNNPTTLAGPKTLRLLESRMRAREQWEEHIIRPRREV